MGRMIIGLIPVTIAAALALMLPDSGRVFMPGCSI
jgi:hypothetical protein